jgi:M6 family metalloprotease-like protein
MISALLLVLVQDETSLREAEARRIAEKRPLTEVERSAYSRPSGEAVRQPVRGYSLAILPIDFSDLKADDPSRLFLEDVRDYYARVSGDLFSLVGKRYGAVKLSQLRNEFGKLGIRSEEERKLLAALVRAWRERDGEGVLAAHGGIAFVSAGKRGARETALWPHQGTLEIDGATLDYILVPSDAGCRAVGIAAHEFGHLLGLPDKYEVGKWCLLGTGYLEKAPALLCAECQASLGWAKVGRVDPRENRTIAFAVGESVRVRLTPNGSEWLLLEGRSKQVVVWHGGGEGRVEFVTALPNASSDRLTPFSEPSFLGRVAGAKEAWITDMRVEEGTAFVTVGPSAPLTPLEEFRRKRIGRRLGP